MKPYGCRAGLTDELSFMPRRCLRSLQAAALTLLLLGLSIGVGAAEAASTTKSAASTTKSAAHVYLLRGAFNVFSLGMDEIAAKLQRQGIYATVNNYLGWSGLADEAAAEYKSGRIKTIILVGHSSGAEAVASMAARLGELGVPVKLVIGLDPLSGPTASGHVGRYINYYVGGGNGKTVNKGRQFSGVLENVGVERIPDVGHFSIDKNQSVQDKVVRDIRAAL